VLIWRQLRHVAHADEQPAPDGRSAEPTRSGTRSAAGDDAR
jgi:hypothetical protein